MDTTAQREQLKRLAQEEYQRKMEAIDWVFNNLPLTGSEDVKALSHPKVASHASSPAGTENNLSFPAIVRLVVPKMQGNFDRIQIAKQIEVDYPAYAGKINVNYLRSTLLKLAREGILKVVSEGGGKNPAVYRYIGGQQ